MGVAEIQVVSTSHEKRIGIETAATPPAIIEKLSAAIRKVLQDPTMRKTLDDQGSTPVGNTPAEFKANLTQEIEKWGKLVRLSGATVD